MIRDGDEEDYSMDLPIEATMNACFSAFDSDNK